MQRDKDFSFDKGEDKYSNPTLVVLVGKDGSQDHAITCYKTMIFDSSYPYALFRCKESLDWCCPKLGFEKVFCAYVLQEREN